MSKFDSDRYIRKHKRLYCTKKIYNIYNITPWLNSVINDLILESWKLNHLFVSEFIN